jgi:hypothetical protein
MVEWSGVKSHRADRRLSIDSLRKARKSQHALFWHMIPFRMSCAIGAFMRGLLMALFAVDFPGHGASQGGRERAQLRTTKTAAKTTTKTV